ncbi:hypothetical protein SD71_00470 [Cohnella kolymensis]|uniref:Uncharacterized protein n=1 Tax=Cohnella kolymensis TaxID=1590652 RepID=A0ABR5A8B0_9BACL|nr:hypothetical protein SD71_00470 [Cohnella kolymensis]
MLQGKGKPAVIVLVRCPVSQQLVQDRPKMIAGIPIVLTGLQGNDTRHAAEEQEAGIRINDGWKRVDDQCNHLL